jgi:DNA polymerase-3 subunit delta
VKQIGLDAWLNDGANIKLPQSVCIFTDEPLFATQAADLYRQRLKKQTNYLRHVIDLDRHFDPQEFLALFAEVSLFGDISLIDLRLSQPKLSKEAAESVSKATQWVADGNTNHHLLINGPKLNKIQEKSTGFSDLLSKGSEIICRPISTENMPGWIVQTAKRKGLQLKNEASSWLAEKTEGNLLIAHQTIEKLALEHQGAINIEHVREIVSNSARFNVFDLGSSLLAGDVKRIIRMIEGLESEGETPTLVLWALQEEIRAIRDTQQMIEVGKSLSEACKQNRIWGQRQNHIAAAIKRHSSGSLQKLNEWCYTAEKTIKGINQGNPWVLFEIIGLGIAGIAPPKLWNT